MEKNKYNLAIMTDSYKVSHYLQFPKDTKKLFYYGESRSKEEEILFFGLQAIIKEYFMEVPTLQQIEEAEDFWKRHGFPDIFNYEGWKRVSQMGYLPIEIYAAPEGMVIPSGHILFSVVNTEEEFYWLPGWIETLLMQVWYPITVATNSFKARKIIMKYLQETADNLEGLPFKLHDFGYRGVSSYQSAMIGGMAHLVNFMGTDTTAGIEGAWKWYDPEGKKEMPAFSIPASEHSTITSWGRKHEKEAFENMLNNFAKPGRIMACVSDSYDIWRAVSELWGEQLRQKIIESGATIVVRPDSGDPVETPIKVVELLDEKFGSKINSKGYKILNHVRVIQGDGITINDMEKILYGLKLKGYSADNIAFGMGAGLLQKLNRDTYKFAFKCSARFDGQRWHPVYKQPVTAPWKKSKKGLLTLIKSPENGFETVSTLDPNATGVLPKLKVLRPIFRNGKLLIDENFSTIRNRISNNNNLK